MSNDTPYFLPAAPNRPWELRLNDENPVVRTHEPSILVLAHKKTGRRVYVATCCAYDSLPSWLAPFAAIVDQRPCVHRWLPDLSGWLMEACNFQRGHKALYRALRRHRRALRYAALAGFPSPSLTLAHRVGGGTYNEFAFIVAAYKLLVRPI